MFIPAIIFGMEMIKDTGVLLKKSKGVISKAWKSKPFDIEGTNLSSYSFVQDLDIGQSSGRFHRLYRGPLYKRYVRRLKEKRELDIRHLTHNVTQQMPIIAITDRPAKDVLQELCNDNLYRDNAFVITSV